MNINQDILSRVYGTLYVIGGLYLSKFPVEYAADEKYFAAAVASLLPAFFVSEGLADVVSGEHHFISSRLCSLIRRK